MEHAHADASPHDLQTVMHVCNCINFFLCEHFFLFYNFANTQIRFSLHSRHVQNLVVDHCNVHNIQFAITRQRSFFEFWNNSMTNTAPMSFSHICHAATHMSCCCSFHFVHTNINCCRILYLITCSSRFCICQS